MDDLPPIDQGRLALFVLDSIDRQVAKFTDPVQNQQVRDHLEGELRAGRVQVIAPDDSEFVHVVLGDTWLARIHRARVARRGDPELN
jgi:hypothetical protein